MERLGRSAAGVLASCIALAISHGAMADTLSTVEVASGLTSPIFATYAPGDATHLYVVERQGLIERVDLTTGQATTFLSIPDTYSSTEEGLLGLAFDPDFNSPGKAGFGKFYVNVNTAPTAGNSGLQNIREYHIDSAAVAHSTADGTLFSFANTLSPYHKAGWIGFSPDTPGTDTTIRAGDDHNLYIATGDGSPYPQLNDVANHAQSLNSDEGKILRININPATPTTHGIPANNPYVGVAGDNPEIYAYGLRNPFRDSFDRVTGDLYIGDVGQDTREEVDFQPASKPGGGENYEWRYREGNIATPLPNGSEVAAGAPSGGVGGPLTGAANETGPILDYAHSGAIDSLSTLVGVCIIGGYVYRGTAIPSLYGKYIFADLISNRVFAMNYDGTQVTQLADLTGQLTPRGGLVSFAEDLAGNLYMIDQGSNSNFAPTGAGTIFKIVSVPEPASCALALGGAGVLLLRRRRSRR